jgi:hypothetical protein
MEITGKIMAVLQMRQGTSKATGNEWQSQEYVLETDEQYPKHVCFNVFGSDKISQFAIKDGEVLNVSFDIDAHEYQGRWYNSIRAWKVDRVVENSSADPQQAGAPAPQAPQFSPSEEADDLPF